jgi:hypothetical protein
LFIFIFVLYYMFSVKLLQVLGEIPIIR